MTKNVLHLFIKLNTVFYIYVTFILQRFIKINLEHPSRIKEG
jgi:hypothetical protein